MEIIISASGGLGAVSVGLDDQELACPTCGATMTFVSASLSPTQATWETACPTHGQSHFSADIELPPFLSLKPEAHG